MFLKDGDTQFSHVVLLVLECTYVQLCEWTTGVLCTWQQFSAPEFSGELEALVQN